MDFCKELLALQLKMPRLGLLNLNAVNSTYNFSTDQSKNCYLLANAVKNQDCMYGRDFYDNTDCCDCAHIAGCTLCYECVNCKNCYNSDFLQDCDNCRDCDYGYDLKGCSKCFGCAGLRKKEFYIFNKPYSRDEYFSEIKKLSRKEIEEKFKQVKAKTPRLFSTQIQTENCTGNYIYNSKNVFYGFDSVGCQDSGYIAESKNLTDSYDIFILEDSAWCYEISSSHILHNCNFCYMCVSASDLEYCEFVNNSKNCFGCISLNHKQYYILNKPYSAEAYVKKVSEIKEQMKKKGLYGKWFLPSSYPLKDTVALWERM